MQSSINLSADVAVVGGGHAGIEAALACARLGLDTVLFTINLDAIGNMPCNPSIGGTGKGQLVFEIDALGGEMAYAADCVTLQSRILNQGKGPAVHSKRIQADRRSYQILMKRTLEEQKNLRIVMAEIVDFTCKTDENGKKHLHSVTTALGSQYFVKAAIICTGTYLNGRVITGEYTRSAGPDGMLPATEFSVSLIREGIRLMRFKTGTPVRIHRDSIDYSALEKQENETDITPFSSRTDPHLFAGRQQTSCYIAYTNENTHDIIRSNLHRSPLYSGVIHGTGPRYCPSIEDKIVRFSDKKRHQLFVEPMGENTAEIYLQGFSSSLPIDVQTQMLHSLRGFEHAHIMRYAYAIEYDCVDPTQMLHTLEFKNISGLYGAGQFNGTSGYEEAAAQGLVAGINAALKIKGQEPMVLLRSNSYIGTLIDDLVTKGTNEPYRIMTSRSEYRLLLRQDNADSRLIEIGHRVGLISDERLAKFRKKEISIANEIERLQKTVISPCEENNRILSQYDSATIVTGISLAELLRRPEISYQRLLPLDPNRPALSADIVKEVQINIKYEGYIKRQTEEANKFLKLENKKIPENIDFRSIKGLRLEAIEKLNKIQPKNIGAASRISGVSPADIAVLLIYLNK